MNEVLANGMVVIIPKCKYQVNKLYTLKIYNVIYIYKL